MYIQRVRGHFGSSHFGSSGPMVVHCYYLTLSLLPMAKADVLHQVAATVGKCWRKHRRAMPLDIEESILDVLLLLRSKMIPNAGVSMATNVKEARVEVGDMFHKLSCVAQRGRTLAITPEPEPQTPSAPPPPYATPPVCAPITETTYIVIVQPAVPMEEQCTACGFIQAAGHYCGWCTWASYANFTAECYDLAENDDTDDFFGYCDAGEEET